MTYQDDCTLPVEFLEQLTREGLEGLPELVRVLVNEAMRIERQNYLGVRPYERSPQRRGRANGYKPKTVKTRLGEIRFDIPQVREKGFYPGALEKGLRSERALLLSLAEMYVQGVSTRKVAAITEQLCGTAVSSAQVSRAAALLDEVLEAWRQRPLGEVRVLYLDARYEKVRVDGQIRDVAILIASGVMPGGKRQILGVSVSLSEVEDPNQGRGALEDVSAGIGGSGDARSAAGGQRRSCWSGSGSESSAWGCALATVPVSSSAECPPVRPAQVHAQRGGRGYPHHLRCAGSGNRGSLFGAHGGQIRAYGFQAFRLAGGEYPGRLDRIRFSEATLATPANDQQPGASQPGDQAPHAGGAHLSQ